jgi:hypothetical protein
MQRVIFVCILGLNVKKRLVELNIQRVQFGIKVTNVQCILHIAQILIDFLLANALKEARDLGLNHHLAY